MGRSCAVPKCRSGYKTNPEHLSWHRLPVEPERREKWIEILKLLHERNGKTFHVVQSTALCSKHFARESYSCGGRLHFDAVPTLCLNPPGTEGSDKEPALPSCAAGDSDLPAVENAHSQWVLNTSLPDNTSCVVVVKTTLLEPHVSIICETSGTEPSGDTWAEMQTCAVPCVIEPSGTTAALQSGVLTTSPASPASHNNDKMLSKPPDILPPTALSPVDLNRGDSGTNTPPAPKRRSRKYYFGDRTPSDVQTPADALRTFMEGKAVISGLKKRLKMSQQKLRRTKKRMEDLQGLFKHLKKKKFKDKDVMNTIQVIDKRISCLIMTLGVKDRSTGTDSISLDTKESKSPPAPVKESR